MLPVHSDRPTGNRMWHPLFLFGTCLLLAVIAYREYRAHQQQTRYEELVDDHRETNNLLQGEIEAREIAQNKLNMVTLERNRFQSDLQRLREKFEEMNARLRKYGISGDTDLIAWLNAWESEKTQAGRNDRYQQIRLEQKLQNYEQGLDHVIESLKALRESGREKSSSIPR